MTTFAAIPTRRRGLARHLVIGAVISLAGATYALAGAVMAPEDRILPADAYTSEKARSLAQRHGESLRELNAKIYHCMPWVDIQRHSIGFFKPKHAVQDDRYLAVRVYVDQEPSTAFAQLQMTERASAMFSRYVGPLLRRMARPALVTDQAVDGFTVIVEWLKQVPASASSRPVHETIAVFVERTDVEDFLAGRTGPQVLAAEARVLGWDGETAVGALSLAAWEDDFVSTHKVKNYEMAQGVSCP